MKRMIMSILALAPLTYGSLFAGFQGPEETKISTSVAEAKKSAKNSKAALTGNIIKKNKNGQYTFKDTTGEILVWIDDDKMEGFTVTPETNVTISGSFTHDSGTIEGSAEFDVNKVQVNNAKKDSAESVPPPPSDATQVGSGTHGECSYTRYSIKQSPISVVDYFDKQFKAGDWKILSKGGGGSSWGGGAGITANKGLQYVKVQAGGRASETFFNIILGSSKKAVEHCDVEE